MGSRFVHLSMFFDLSGLRKNLALIFLKFLSFSIQNFNSCFSWWPATLNKIINTHICDSCSVCLPHLVTLKLLLTLFHSSSDASGNMLGVNSKILTAIIRNHSHETKID